MKTSQQGSNRNHPVALEHPTPKHAHILIKRQSHVALSDIEYIPGNPEVPSWIYIFIHVVWG